MNFDLVPKQTHFIVETCDTNKNIACVYKRKLTAVNDCSLLLFPPFFSTSLHQCVMRANQCSKSAIHVEESEESEESE